jgi:sialic acid synthase SpsE
MKIQIVAELAQGFEGDPRQARLLLYAAAAAGADAAKYQLVYADELATPDYKYYDLFRSLEMPDQIWADLAAYAIEQKIELQLDVFGSRSLGLAEEIGVKTVKLHGTDISNVALLDEVAQSAIHRVFLGAGGAHLSEIEEAVSKLRMKSVVVLLGFQGYPTPTDTNQISRVRFLVDHLSTRMENIEIGFADHATPESPLKYALSAAALGAGAAVIEKHLTLSKTMKLEDYESALNPDEFKDFAELMRECYSALGKVELRDTFGMSENETNYRKTIRRHVVSSREISTGTVLSPADLVLKRTASNNPITSLREAYGRVSCRSLSPNTALQVNDIE